MPIEREWSGFSLTLIGDCFTRQGYHTAAFYYYIQALKSQAKEYHLTNCLQQQINVGVTLKGLANLLALINFSAFKPIRQEVLKLNALFLDRNKHNEYHEQHAQSVTDLLANILTQQHHLAFELQRKEVICGSFDHFDNPIHTDYAVKTFIEAAVSQSKTAHEAYLQLMQKALSCIKNKHFAQYPYQQLKLELGKELLIRFAALPPTIAQEVLDNPDYATFARFVKEERDLISDIFKQVTPQYQPQRFFSATIIASATNKSSATAANPGEPSQPTPSAAGSS